MSGLLFQFLKNHVSKFPKLNDSFAKLIGLSFPKCQFSSIKIQNHQK